MSDYCPDDTPEDLRKAIHGGNFVDWLKKASAEELQVALRTVYTNYANFPLIQKEIEHRQSQKTNEMLSLVESHLAELKEPHRIVKWTLVMTAATFLICLWTWLFPRLPAGANNSPTSQQPVAAPQSLPASLLKPASIQPSAGQVTAPLGPVTPRTNAAPSTPAQEKNSKSSQ